MAISLNPEDTKAMCNLGGILEKQGKLDEASSVLRRCLSLDPGDQFSQYHLDKVQERLSNLPTNTSGTSKREQETPKVSAKTPAQLASNNYSRFDNIDTDSD